MLDFNQSKAMSVTLLIIMVGVVLIMFGLTALTMFRGNMAQFESLIFSSVEEKACLQKRDRFCSRTDGKWYASKVEYKGTTCADILNPGEGMETVFNCNSNQWTANICGELGTLLPYCEPVS